MHIANDTFWPSSPPRRIGHRPQPDLVDLPSSPWLKKLRRVARDEPLIQTGPSLSSLRNLPPRPAPRCVFMGVGLCTPSTLTQALPLDVLGMILPAETIRAALNIDQLVLLVADTHARTHRFPPRQVEARANLATEQLERIKHRLGLSRMTVLRASDFHDTAPYRKILSSVYRQADFDIPEYVRRQVADVAYLSQERGPIIKVGWSLGSGPARRDERALDALVHPLTRTDATYVYCRPGTALDDQRPKAAPYVAINEKTRICLTADENVAEKLQSAQQCTSDPTIRAVKNHLKAITSTYAKAIAPLSGHVPKRAQSVIETLCNQNIVSAP